MRTATGLLVAASLLGTPAFTLACQADTLPPRPLFTKNDALLAGVFAVGALLARPLDKSFAQRLQNPAAQENRLLRKSSQFVETVAVPGAFFIGGGMYVAGRVAKDRKLADLGLHGTEALAAGSMLGGVLKGVFGRGRPYLNPKDPNPDDWQLMRGFRGNDAYRSFPSGHAVAAFAAGAAVTSEMSRWYPESRWLVGSVMYGGAGMVAFSRMYHQRHWASDVIIGAAIGTFAGNKVVRYHHSHPGNRLDEWLVNFSISPEAGFKSLQASVLPRLR